MAWNDVVLMTELTNDEIRKRLSGVFNLNVNDVLVLDDFTVDRENSHLLVIRERVGGEFNTILHFYPDFEIFDDVEVLKKLGVSLGTRVLTNANDDNIYEVIISDAEGEIYLGKLSSEKLDCDGTFYLVG